jgi:hypothetical protein
MEKVWFAVAIEAVEQRFFGAQESVWRSAISGLI